MDLDELFRNFVVVGISRAPKKTSARSTGKPRQPRSSCVLQNFIVVWLHPHADGLDPDDRNESLAALQRIVNTTHVFTDVDRCVDFVSDVREEKVFLIVSGMPTETIVSLVHDISQINSIYIFCKNQFSPQPATSKWPKVKGSFQSIASLSETVRQDAYNCDQDCISFGIIPSNTNRRKENIDELDPTFMYTQILKEILLKIDFNSNHIKDFASYYREHFVDNAVQLNNFKEFEQDYGNHQPTWWYTHECCLYSLLNRALRTMEVDVLIKMGFFIRDLHNQIGQLHSTQRREDSLMKPFTTYRGQGLSKKEFARLSETQGGLISFNNFLSTSKDPEVAYGFARSALANLNSVGVVFIMKIDPSLNSTPFAFINDVSYYKKEEEVLFSMHTVFRIGDMVEGEKNGRLWQVDLIQTADNDTQLSTLAERMRLEITGETGWERLGKLLLKLNQFEKAEKLYEVLLDRANNDRQKMHLYHQLGWTAKKQNKYEEAIESYEKELELRQKIFPENHRLFADSYKEIGSVHEKMSQYSHALLYYEKGLSIQINSKSTNLAGLGIACSNIGSVYEKMNDYPQALDFHGKAIKIRETLLPSEQSSLAHSYNNRGSVYEKMGEYEKAIESHQKALQIQEKFLPPNHPDLAQTNSNIGFVYSKLHEYPKARQFHQKAVDIGHRSLPGDHPRLEQWKRNLHYVKRKCN